MSLLFLYKPRNILDAIYNAVTAFFATFRKYVFKADYKPLVVLADARDYEHFINKSYLVKTDYRKMTFKVDEFYNE